MHVADQRLGLVLRLHRDPAQLRVDAVREREVNRSVAAAERHRGLGLARRQTTEPAPGAPARTSAIASSVHCRPLRSRGADANMGPDHFQKTKAKTQPLQCASAPRQDFTRLAAAHGHSKRLVASAVPDAAIAVRAPARGHGTVGCWARPSSRRLATSGRWSDTCSTSFSVAAVTRSSGALKQILSSGSRGKRDG